MAETILIAEDYDDNRELLRLLLKSAGYQVLEARNGQECLDVARSSRPDLIMVDLSMPNMDGWEVCRRLKSDPQTAYIPCVAVTAHAVDHGSRASFRAFIDKPFRTEELLDTVAQLLGSVEVN